MTPARHPVFFIVVTDRFTCAVVATLVELSVLASVGACTVPISGALASVAYADGAAALAKNDARVVAKIED